MTKSQEKTIERIKESIKKHLFYGDNFEIKKFEVKETDFGKVSLYFETGMIGDEGTYGEIYGRDRAFLFIGEKGQVYYFNRKGTKKVLRRYGVDYIVITAVCDQHY